jgi:hypothetical protein
VHELFGVGDDRTEGLSDGLVPETDAQQGLTGAEGLPNGAIDTPASAGLPGPGEMSTAS